MKNFLFYLLIAIIFTYIAFSIIPKEHQETIYEINGEIADKTKEQKELAPQDIPISLEDFNSPIIPEETLPTIEQKTSPRPTPDLPHDMEEQRSPQILELPEEMREQLLNPSREIPEDLREQLQAKPIEVPEDIKRSMETPPRIAPIEEVNQGLSE